MAQVERFEKDIKAGIEFSFPWLNDEGITRVKHYTLLEAVNEYMKTRRNGGLTKSTIKRDINSFNALISVLGKSFPMTHFGNEHIELFKETFAGMHAPEGINLNLRAIKAFLNWCEDRGVLSNKPKVAMVKTPKSPPSYITDADWAEIMKLERLGDHFKRAFYFYRETGCRLSEPFYAIGNGNWIVIPAEYTKQKVEKEVELTDELIRIWREMQSRFDSTKFKPENFIHRYSKEFKKACRAIGIENHFHDLRHTFAVRRWLQTGDIYLVKEEMGHSSVTTTEKYAKFSRKRLAVDFPSLADFYGNGGNRSKNAIMDTVSMDTKEMERADARR